MDYAKRNNAKLLVAATLMTFSGCATTAGSLAGGDTFVGVSGWKCAPGCRLDIVLPGKGKRPELPRHQTTLAIEGGKDVTIQAPPANVGKFMLIFEHAALLGFPPQGEPKDPDNVLYVIELTPGANNRFRALPAGSCPPAGCKYIIVDKNDPTRPPLDPWIILY